MMISLPAKDVSKVMVAESPRESLSEITPVTLSVPPLANALNVKPLALLKSIFESVKNELAATDLRSHVAFNAPTVPVIIESCTSKLPLTPLTPTSPLTLKVTKPPCVLISTPPPLS